MMWLLPRALSAIALAGLVGATAAPPRWSTVALGAESSPAEREPNPAERLDAEPFQQLVRGIILNEVKEKYEDNRHWGQKKQIEQVQVRGKWFEPRLEKKTVEVNDGLWQRIEVKLVEPDKNLRARLLPKAPDKPNRSAFSLDLGAKLSGEAHIERSRAGVKLFNATVLFDARIAARIDCELGIRLEPSRWVDDVVIDPRVTAVDLRLEEFDLKKVGVLGRDVARELSDPLRPIIEQEIKRREGRIVEKANAAIDKRRDQLRFSADKLVTSGWSKLQSTLLGEPN